MLILFVSKSCENVTCFYAILQKPLYNIPFNAVEILYKSTTPLGIAGAVQLA